MRTDLVTTRSLPFGFRSVNRKLQPRLVCNEHNGDSGRVKVGQLGCGKRTSERASGRRRGDKKRETSAAPRARARARSFSPGRGKKIDGGFGRCERSITRKRETSLPVSEHLTRDEGTRGASRFTVHACLDKTRTRPRQRVFSPAPCPENYAATLHPFCGNQCSSSSSSWLISGSFPFRFAAFATETSTPR